jgi:hypothetical protein
LGGKTKREGQRERERKGGLVSLVVPLSLDHVTYWQKNTSWSIAAMILKEKKQRH